MTTESWEIWYPKAGATGLLLARGRTDVTESILVHSAPEVVNIEVRDEAGERVAYSEDLQRSLVSPMTRFRRNGQAILRDDIWPEEADIGSVVLFPGGEFGILKSWWHAEDRKQWRFNVEFFNSLDSGVSTAPAVGAGRSSGDQSGEKSPVSAGKKASFSQ